MLSRAMLCFLGLANFVDARSTIDNIQAYSRSANAGWLNWHDAGISQTSGADGVVIGEFICSGYVYGANVGWVNLGNGSPANHIQYQNNSATDFGVNYNSDPTQPGVAILRGFAYAANIGWINFEATGNPRLSLFTGAFSGYAYSANCGWINLNDSLGKVQTNQIVMGVDSNGNSLADAWEYLYFGSLLAPGAENSAPNGSGMTLLDDYRDGVNPLVPNGGLRVTAFSTNTSGGSQISAITWTSTTARLYTIEVNPDLSQPLNWTDSGLGLFAPDVGANTVRSVALAATGRRFFRVRTMRPLP